MYIYIKLRVKRHTKIKQKMHLKRLVDKPTWLMLATLFPITTRTRYYCSSYDRITTFLV